MWQGREGPLNYIESLKEAPLGWLQGMTNGNQAGRGTIVLHVSSLQTWFCRCLMPSLDIPGIHMKSCWLVTIRTAAPASLAPALVVQVSMLKL